MLLVCWCYCVMKVGTVSDACHMSQFVLSTLCLYECVVDE